jgi:hypothetical protein
MAAISLAERSYDRLSENEHFERIARTRSIDRAARMMFGAC